MSIFFIYNNLLFTEFINNNKINEQWVTIFIHGSFSLRPHLGLRNMIKMIHDSIEESIYYRSTEINRRDPFFYKNQAMSGLGIEKIDIHNPHNNAASPILAASFEEISTSVGYPKTDEYYNFGWSGLISNKLRYLEARFLYKDLDKIIKKLQSEGIKPKVRLIGCSHGGNLALQLGALYMEKTISKDFCIDELWLLGTPIQIETDYFINSPIFKKVYNFYSRADRVQTLDCFSSKRFFSRKKFSKRHNFALPDKLVQIRIKMTEYEPYSKKFVYNSVPKNQKELKRNFKAINSDPGHFELWFMGWTILTYRKTFPFYPLPVLTFLPIITKYIEQNPDMPRDIVAHIKPELNTIEFIPYHTVKSKYHREFTFINQELLKHMQYHVTKFIPKDYNIEIYNQKVYGAMNIVECEHKEIRKILKLEKKKKEKLPKTLNIHKTDKYYKGHLVPNLDQK